MNRNLADIAPLLCSLVGLFPVPTGAPSPPARRATLRFLRLASETAR